jgi:putative transposase
MCYESLNGPRGQGGLSVKRKRHTPEEVVKKLREAERMVAEGAGVAQVCRQLGVSEHTYYRWRAEYGGMAQSEAKRLKELERENAKLKRIVAEQAMDIDALKDLLKKKF